MSVSLDGTNGLLSCDTVALDPALVEVTTERQQVGLDNGIDRRVIAFQLFRVMAGGASGSERGISYISV